MSRSTGAPPWPIPPARRFLEPIERFLHVEAASGIVLLVAAAAALIWANSRWGASYDHFWHLPLTLGIGAWVSDESLHFWINEGLMTVFFLVVGLEIRREMHEGALASLQQASLPAIAALGGVLMPAAIYLLVNVQNPALLRGWAVPTATDIAFAVGVLALLGKRVPRELRVLLLALAIIDDIAAIVIIALFYSTGVSIEGLGIAAAGIACVLAFQYLGIRSAWLYVLPGAIVWLGMLRANVHPAIGGVILGLLTPVVHRYATDDSVPPAARVQTALHPWVAYVIMPLFALANAGVSFAGLSFDNAAFTGIVAGVAAGLVLGKPFGIALATAVGVRLGWCALPVGIGAAAVAVLGCLGGIGFTMAIFIANLAFVDQGMLAAAKFAVLVASAIAAVLGLMIARLALPSKQV
jgi:NhaA family Na+:H+ antiporter